MMGRIGSAIVVSTVLSAGATLGCVRSPFGPPPICERFWEEDAVALVDVQNIEMHGHNRRVTLSVVDTYRGNPPSNLTINDPVTDCGANFGRKARYLAWFSHTESGKWTAYSGGADSFADNLHYAQLMKTPSKTGRIYGTLDKPRRNFFVTTPSPSQYLPDRRGVVIVAENEGRRFTTTVGSDLNFDFPNLTPGRYQVRVEGLPSDLAVDSREIEVHGSGCNELALFAVSSASISGRVVGDGKLPRAAQVFLVPERDVLNFTRSVSSWVMTDIESGAFLFKHVVPGKYVLGFELGHSPTLDVPYAPRFFPEGIDGEKATVIEVGSGQKIVGVRFDVGHEVARRRVRTRVTWADGSPAINATAYLRDAHNPYSAVANEQTPTDANGEAILEGFVDTDYDVDANAVCKGHSISNQIKKKTIAAGSKDVLVELSVEGRKCPLIVERNNAEDE